MGTSLHHPDRMPVERERMKVATIKIPADLLRRCDAIVERECLSRAAAIRRAVLHDVEQREATS